LAELVLGYCDVGINKRAEQYPGVKVLRYRDDYRIFGSSDADCEAVLKIISEELITFGMRLGAAKTSDEQNLVVGAVKKDKVKALKLVLHQKTLQKQLLMIHDFCVTSPGAGALKFLLSKFIETLEGKDASKSLERENSTVLVAILMDIGSTSPNVFPAVATASSMIMNHLEKDEKERVFSLILKKTSRIPNNGYLEIWLQRIAVANGMAILSNEKMCRMIEPNEQSIWNFDWVGSDDVKKLLNEYAIVDQTKIASLTPYIERSEFDAFWKGYD
jgi:hypothetical protein